MNLCVVSLYLVSIRLASLCHGIVNSFVSIIVIYVITLMLRQLTELSSYPTSVFNSFCCLSTYGLVRHYTCLSVRSRHSGFIPLKNRPEFEFTVRDSLCLCLIIHS